MAYPFIPLPSLNDFITRVISTKYKARIETVNMSGPRGNVEIKVLVRKGKKGKQRLAVIPDLKENDILTPHVLSSMCAQLDIAPRDFGLHLD
jgi:hypothetical protein